MKEKTIGILGGMGPEATLDCFARIIKNTPAKTDQEHLRVIIDSNPIVPVNDAIEDTTDSSLLTLWRIFQCLKI